MLRELQIRNFALIDELAVSFEPGLNVITGETGAGKTILMAALALAVGGKASSEVIRTGEEEAAIEAVFEPGRAGGDAGRARRRRLRRRRRRAARAPCALAKRPEPHPPERHARDALRTRI